MPFNKFRNIISEISSIAARREALTLSAFDALEYRYPSLAQALLDQVGNKRRAAHWLCAPQRACDGRSPCDLLADGDRDGVWDLLDGLGMVEVPRPPADPRLTY
jgi:uncharacterized protein (DUF2384 family)